MRLRQGNDVKMTMPMEHSKPLPQWCIFIYLKIRIWFTLISILAINIACYVWMLADDGVIWFAFLVHSQCLLTARKKTMCNECVLYLCRQVKFANKKLWKNCGKFCLPADKMKICSYVTWILFVMLPRGWGEGNKHIFGDQSEPIYVCKDEQI